MRYETYLDGRRSRRFEEIDGMFLKGSQQKKNSLRFSGEKLRKRDEFPTTGQ